MSIECPENWKYWKLLYFIKLFRAKKNAMNPLQEGVRNQQRKLG